MIWVPVLRRVRQLEKKLMITDNRLPAVREVLARFSDRLSQAQSLLQGAANHVQETNDRNRANDLKVLRSQVSPGHAPPHVCHMTPSGHSCTWRSAGVQVWEVHLEGLGWMDDGG